jgi:hypothetical protein
MRFTPEQYNEYLKKRGQKVGKSKGKKQKYNNQGNWYDGIYFRSQLELRRYCQLKILMNTGEISGFIIQPRFILQIGDENNKAITYSGDFLILNNDGTYIVEDTKGYENQQWQRTYKMFKLKYPNVELKILKNEDV